MNGSLAARFFLSFLLLFFWPQYSNALEPDWDLLNQGKVQTAIEVFKTEGGDKKRGVGMVILPIDIEGAWKVKSDWDSMGEYVPNLKYYKTVYRGEKEKYIAGKLRILFVNIKYPLLVEFEAGQYNHTWRMLRREELPNIGKRGIKGLVPPNAIIKNIVGFWELRPIDENNTLFYYSTLVSTKLPVPQTIEAYISKLTLPKYLAATRQQIIDNRKAKETESDFKAME